MNKNKLRIQLLYTFHMHWAATHPYAVSLGIAGALLILGAGIVEYRGGTTVIRDVQGFGSGANLLNPLPPAQNPIAGAPLFNPATNTPFLIYTNTSSGSENAAVTLDEIFAELLQKPGKPTPNTAKPDQGTGFYEFIPQGFITASAPTETRTELQQSLFNYGNEVGSYIQSYEDLNRGAAQILRDQAEDRANTEKAAKVKQIGVSLVRVGRNLESMEEIPAPARSPHERLAASYVEIGTKLQAIPDTETDKAFLEAVLSYNAAAETFIRSYVALARLFTMHEVRFESHDSGSVFTFQGSAL